MPSLNEPVPAGSLADVTLCWKLRRPSEAAVKVVAVTSTKFDPAELKLPERTR